MGGDAPRRRDEDNSFVSRALAERLVATAEEMADLMDRAAALHDAFARDAAHPLYDVSATRAAAQRRIAAAERAAAARWRDDLGLGHASTADA